MGKPLRLPDFKAGATFLLPVFKTDAAGEMEPLAGAEVNSQLRDANDNLIAQLTFVPKSGGLFDGHLEPVDPDTSAWPIGDLYCDIVVTLAGIVMPTETFIQPVTRGITHA